MKRPKNTLTALGVAAIVLGMFAGVVSAQPAKQDVCHVTGNGSYRLISVSERAVPAHEAHGDVLAGTGGLDEDCNEVETTIVTSDPLQFGPNGWGGWSCPTGTTAVGGGHTLGSVSDEGVAAPGADPVDGFSYPTYPHYTFNVAAGETGYVVHNDNDSETGTVFVECAAD